MVCQLIHHFLFQTTWFKMVIFRFLTFILLRIKDIGYLQRSKPSFSDRYLLNRMLSV